MCDSYRSITSRHMGAHYCGLVHPGCESGTDTQGFSRAGAAKSAVQKIIGTASIYPLPDRR